MAKLGLILYIIASITHYACSLFIDGCPMAGCRPSGSFSFYLQVPRDNVSVKWISNFVLDPVPSALGCVSDSVNIVCLSNGPFSEDQGYVSLFNTNGTVKWRDRKLNFPTLPLLDNYGDVTGSDGIKLVHYDADGTKYPTIPCEGLVPLFNMALVGNTFLLLVSKNGMIVVRDTNGVPVGSLTLNATSRGVNGTYLPIAQPVINQQRFYLLTEFAPLQSNNRNAESSRRLYAIDVHQSISNRITIAWHIDFPNKHKLVNEKRYKNTIYGISSNAMREHVHDDAVTYGNASLIWNRYNNTIYVITPDTAEIASPNMLSGIRDKGGDGELIFQSRFDVYHMAMFVSDHCDTCGETKYSAIDPKLWAVTQDSKIHLISEQGMSVRVIDLNHLLNSSVSMTTKMSLVRNSDTDNDVLIFGLKLTTKYQSMKRENVQTSFVVAIDTAATANVLWMLPIPENMIARGQITGVSGTDMREKDQLIVYAETPGKSAKIFSIN